MEQLEDALDEDGRTNCQKLLNGEVPAFFNTLLTPEQRPAAIQGVKTQCGNYQTEVLQDRIKENPKTVCPAIVDGKLPDEATSMMTQAQQTRFLQAAGAIAGNNWQIPEQATLATNSAQRPANP